MAEARAQPEPQDPPRDAGAFATMLRDSGLERRVRLVRALVSPQVPIPVGTEPARASAIPGNTPNGERLCEPYASKGAYVHALELAVMGRTERFSRMNRPRTWTGRPLGPRDAHCRQISAVSGTSLPRS